MGKWIKPDKGAVGGIQHRAVNIKAIWVRPVQYHQFHIIFGACLHYIMQGRQVSVKPCTDILYIKYHQVEALQISRRGFIMFAI